LTKKILLSRSRPRWERMSDIIISTINEIPGREIAETLGILSKEIQ